jgi:hypothetical protein
MQVEQGQKPAPFLSALAPCSLLPPTTFSLAKPSILFSLPPSLTLAVVLQVILVHCSAARDHLPPCVVQGFYTSHARNEKSEQSQAQGA